MNAAVTSPLTIIASDAYWENGLGHPRTTGTYSKVLGRYVREESSAEVRQPVPDLMGEPCVQSGAAVSIGHQLMPKRISASVTADEEQSLPAPLARRGHFERMAVFPPSRRPRPVHRHWI